MNINIKKLFTLFFTLVLCFCVFTGTAFAQSTPSIPNTPPASESVGPDTGSKDETITPPEESEKPNSDGKNEPKDNPHESSNPGKGKSKPESNHTKSNPQNSSKDGNPSSKAKKPAPKNNVDTQKNRIEAAASQAENATSDPDLLSSQSWDELLTSEDKNESEVEAGAGTVSETNTPGIAGVSWILILGVVLIVLALCGIGLFIYLQFFNKDKIPVKSKSQYKAPTEFEDISSDSSRQVYEKNLPPVSHDTKVFTNIKSSSMPPKVNPNYRRRPSSDKDETAPLPNVSRPDLLSKSQAKPTTPKSDFDWKKFFDEDN